MVTSGVARKPDEQPTPPDIFRAAANDDPIELVAALADGQSLDSQSGEFYRMTPVHIACVHQSTNFLEVALKHNFNAWTRDGNGRISMDHAVAQGLEEVADDLLAKLYPNGADGRPLMPF